MNRKKTVRRFKKAFASTQKKTSRGLASLMEAAAKSLKAGAKTMKEGGEKLKKAEQRGDLDKWKTRVGLGLQALEVAAVASAAAKGAHVRIGRPRRAPAKKTTRRRTTTKSRSR
jgi:hypothetical protein